MEDDALRPMGATFVGREAELRKLAAHLEGARTGAGRLVVVEGEPGIGKTRLCDELSAIAQERGAAVLWGRCWEAGGAPAYWPWIEIVREAMRIQAFTNVAAAEAEAAAIVSRIVPALARRLELTPVASTLDPAAERFRLFDALVSLLRELAVEVPLMLVIDDAHVADPASLHMLQLLSRSLRGSRIMVVVTWRDADARRASIDEQLENIAREGERIVLHRLSAGEIAEWMSQVAVRGDARSLHRTTEGNPLYIQELIRQLEQGYTPDETTIPAGIRAVIAQHLASIPDPTRDVLAIASVLGRDIDLRRLRLLLDSELARGVQEHIHVAESAGLLRAAGDRGFAFRHIMIREVLYEALSSECRAALHWRLGMLLLDDSGAEIRTETEAAHHLLAGVEAGDVEVAVRLAKQAALSAATVLAFEEASTLACRGAGLLPSTDPRHRELLLIAADALIRAGDGMAGRELSITVANLARSQGDAELQARAALTYGAEIVGPFSDPVMVELLEGALEVTPTHDTTLRAQLLARLAAAMIPVRGRKPFSRDSLDKAQARAREALRSADPDVDPRTRLYVLQWATSALLVSLTPDERGALTTEAVEIADRLGDEIGVLLVRTWRTMHRLETGDPDADEQIEAFAARLERLSWPNYTWRAPLLRATLATCRGDFAAARSMADRALEIGRDGGVRVAPFFWAVQRMGIARAFGDPTELLPMRARLEEILGRFEWEHELRAYLAALFDDCETLNEQLSLSATPDIAVGTVISVASVEGYLHVGDLETAEAFGRFLEPRVELTPVLWGPGACTNYGPLALVLASIAERAGRLDDAIRWFEQARRTSEVLRLWPFAVQAAMGLGRTRLTRSQAGDHENALETLSAARTGAARLGMDRCHAAISAQLEQLGRPFGPASAVERRDAVDRMDAVESPVVLQREGKGWILIAADTRIPLDDGKGVQYLAMLLEQPGKDIHVLTLLGLEPATALSGDAGPLLDEEAKEAYRKRIGVLRTRLEAARARDDPAAAERIEDEIDALTRELRRAVGLGGRDRKASSGVERARVNVQRRLRHVLQRIAEREPALAAWLDVAIRTGTSCRYDPPPDPFRR